VSKAHCWKLKKKKKLLISHEFPSLKTYHLVWSSLLRFLSPMEGREIRNLEGRVRERERSGIKLNKRLYLIKIDNLLKFILKKE
jgi:hypothetical protein